MVTMLPAVNRLRSNKDFRQVYSLGKSHVSGYAVIYVMPRPDNSAGNLRIGFVVSKKQGKAVVRNRMKRRFRDAVNRQLPMIAFDAPCDVVFVLRSRLKTASWEEVQTAAAELLRRSGLLKRTDT
jgi:ribonuclease P protein component